MPLVPDQPPAGHEPRFVYDEILAAHKIGGEVHVLVSWEGHRMLSWIPASDTEQSIEDVPQDLVDDADLTAQPRVAAPEFYTMYTGNLQPLYCCTDCTKYKDAFDYRVYVDASRVGNVRSLFLFLCTLLLKSTVHSSLGIL